jgi:hypothetical protein
MKFELPREIFEKISNIKFHENPSHRCPGFSMPKERLAVGLSCASHEGVRMSGDITSTHPYDFMAYTMLWNCNNYIYIMILDGITVFTKVC